MPNSSYVFFSNRVERLFVQLKARLFHSSHPFAKRVIIVPSPAMKTWLMMQMARDPDLGIATGVEIGYAEQSLTKLFTFLSLDGERKNPPSSLEIALALEKKIHQILNDYISGSVSDVWNPLLAYLKFSLEEVKDGELKSRTEKRIIALTQRMSHLFMEYGKYGGRMLMDWQTKTSPVHWQQRLWLFLESEFFPWNYPYRQLESFNFNPDCHCQTQVHVFGLSYLSSLHHRFLMKVSEHLPVNYYLLSPCQEFWSDLLSQRQSQRLKTYWKKRGASSSQQIALEEYLQDTNALLANFGRLGREMALQIENSDLQSIEDYELPLSIQEENSYKELLTDQIAFQDTRQPFTLLEALQADLTLLRNPDIGEKVIFKSYDESIQVHKASRPMQEVQVLYNALLKAIDKQSETGNPLYPNEMIVMAPNMMEYEPFIKAVFGSQESVLDYQIMDLRMPAQSLIVQSFLHLLKIPLGRWDVTSLLRLFDFQCFQKRHQLTSEDVQQIRYWVKKAGIKWGKNRQHRNEMLKRNHCLHEMIEEGDNGTWEYGLGRILAALAMLPDQQEYLHTNTSFPPLDILEVTQGELLGKLIYLLQSLLSDLKPLGNGLLFTLKEWSAYLKCLLEAYFDIPQLHHEEKDCYRTLLQRIEAFSTASKYFGEHPFSFLSIQKHLESFLTEETINYRENHLHAVKFCSLLPMRSIPAKVVALLGMEEEAFPRKDDHLSLNLLLNNTQADYYPSHVDFDRYLFLEALLSSRQYFIIVYGKNQKEQLPSLLVTELLNYLDQAYAIGNKKASQVCVYQHPFLSFDQSYFSRNPPSNYSLSDYRAAVAHYQPEKKPAYQFVPHFQHTLKQEKEVKELYLNLSELHSFAKDPIKVFFNKTLGIFLEKNEDPLLKNEEKFQISSLDMAILSRKALSNPLEMILNYGAKEGLFPQGPFKQVNRDKIEDELARLKFNFSFLGVNHDQFFEIEFNDLYQKTFQADEKIWKAPPLVIPYGERRIKLVGKFSNVSPQGWVEYIREDAVDVVKTWPSLLAFSCLNQGYNIPTKNQIIFAKSGKAKTLDFAKPEEMLKNYLDYYFAGMNNLSPLIPEWVPPILSLDASEFSKEISHRLENDQRPLYHDYLRWLLHGSVHSTQSIVENWKRLAHQLFGGLCEWFPKLHKDEKEKNDVEL